MIKYKEKLSEEKFFEYDKMHKPKIFRLLIFSFLPLIALCTYVMLSHEETYSMRLFANSGLAIVIITFFGYLRGKKAIKHSDHEEHFQYALFYFFYIGAGQLFIFLALANSVNHLING